MPKDAPRPISLPEDVWRRPEVTELCSNQDADGLFRLAKKYGFTNESIAYWTGFDPGEISKRINGAKGPVQALDRWRRIAEALGMPDHARMMIGLAPLDQQPYNSEQLHPEHFRSGNSIGETSTKDSEENVNRRELLRLLGTAGALAVVAPAAIAPWEQLSAALNGRPSEALDELHQRTAGLFSLEERVPARTLGPVTTAHLDVLRSRIEREGNNRQIVSLAGETAALAGWLAFDQDDLPTARSYYRVALDAAKHADDPALRACVLGYMSYAPNETVNGPATLLSQARASAERSATPMTRAWLAARHAEEQVKRGDTRGALTSLDTAHELHSKAGAGDRAWTYFFDSSRLMGMAAASYTRLGRHDVAQERADAALSALGSINLKRRSLVLIDLASASLAVGQIEQSAEYAASSLNSAILTNHQYGITRVRQFCSQLAAASPRAAQRLSAELSVLP